MGRKESLHPAHEFVCKAPSDESCGGKGLGWRKGCGKAFGKGWWKGLGKPHGHHHKESGKWWSNGWGKGCDSSNSTDSDMSSTSDSEKSAGETSKGEIRSAKLESKREMRDARRARKKAMHEAKKRLKAAKKVWKEAKHAQKEKAKAVKMVAKHGHCMQDETMTVAAECSGKSWDFSFPVEVADGRNMAICWNKGDVPEETAAKFAMQHQIAPDELPSIIGFIQHANAVAVDASMAVPSEQMEASEAAPSVPLYAGWNETQLEALEQMGFTNREQNMQLLVAHNGNLQTVLERLL